MASEKKVDFLEDVFAELEAKVDEYAQESHFDLIIEDSLTIDTESIVEVVVGLMPDKAMKSYSLDKDVINVIDAIVSNLLPLGVKPTRSEIVNKFLDLAFTHYKDGTLFVADKDNLLDLDNLNIDFCTNYFQVTRSEADKEMIEKFSIVNERGKKGIRLDLKVAHTKFLKEISSNSTKDNTSFVLNAILRALLFKKSTQNTKGL